MWVSVCFKILSSNLPLFKNVGFRGLQNEPKLFTIMCKVGYSIGLKKALGGFKDKAAKVSPGALSASVLVQKSTSVILMISS